MSATLENTSEEIKDLIGATIEHIWVEGAAHDYDQPKVRIRVRYREDYIVNGSHFGEYEIWQDEEGNGPGYLAFMGDAG